MEFRCGSCGNVFDDSLGVCPACGSPVNPSADMPNFVEQVNINNEANNNTFPAAEPVVEPTAQQQPEQQNHDSYANTNNSANGQQTQAPPSYQYQSYSYSAGQQPNYQQGYQQGQPQQAYYQPNTVYANTDPNAKSKILAGLLGIFLGGLGIHNFYLGYTGKAVAQLLISILSCGAFAPISAIWGLIEGILILTGSTITTDASGRPLSE